MPPFLRCLFCVVLGALIGSTIGIAVSLCGLAVQGIGGLGLFFLGIPVGLLGLSAGAVTGARLWKRGSQLPMNHRQAIMETMLWFFFGTLFLAIVLALVVLHETRSRNPRGFWGDL